MIRKYWGQVWKLRSFDKGKKGQMQGRKKKEKKWSCDLWNGIKLAAKEDHLE